MELEAREPLLDATDRSVGSCERKDRDRDGDLQGEDGETDGLRPANKVMVYFGRPTERSSRNLYVDAPFGHDSHCLDKMFARSKGAHVGTDLLVEVTRPCPPFTCGLYLCFLLILRVVSSGTRGSVFYVLRGMAYATLFSWAKKDLLREISVYTIVSKLDELCKSCSLSKTDEHLIVIEVCGKGEPVCNDESGNDQSFGDVTTPNSEFFLSDSVVRGS
ncbi:hypothetical protein VNO80_25779 [Phaseolus coccineus]|uniref:Uncharacterized protein n=1 Tax=Phaseolus coccineus TaxID=3886 RepID=A0AAN9LZ90_PHACN